MSKTKNKLKITGLILTAVLMLATVAVLLCLMPLKAEAATTEKVYIKEVVIEYNGYYLDAQRTLTNAGYTVVKYNLDQGASDSRASYLGYKTTTDPSEAITGIIFRLGANPPDPYTYRGCTFYVIDDTSYQRQDVNQGISASFLYGYYTKDRGWGAPLTEIVVNGESSLSGYTTAIFGRSDGEYFDGQPAHLNQNLNGNSTYPAVYLHYKTCDHADATKSYINNGNNHSYTWSCCNTAITENHTYNNGYCALCKTYQPATGSGTQESPYQIATLSNLMWFAQQVNEGSILAHHARLAADITIDNSVIWTPITLSDNQPSNFNGAGYSITFANTREESSFGLFGSYNYSVIENLYLAGNITCNTTANTGVLVNSAYRTTIRNVFSTCSITNTATSGGTGGLAGQFGGRHSGGQYSLIENCAVYADVIGGGSAGGFIGNIWGGNQYCEIRNSAYVGNVQGTVNTGAIAGYNGNNSSTTSIFTAVYYFEDGNADMIGALGSGKLNVTNVEAKSTEAFASGEVAYLLGSAWGQTLKSDGRDAYPRIGDEQVYQIKICDGSILYSNTAGDIEDHEYDNGFCKYCDGFEPCLGSGTEADPYQIGNAGQLYWLRANKNGTTTLVYAVLTADIVINENLLTADGDLSTGDFRKWSTMTISIDLDGQFHTISGLYCTDQDAAFLYYSSSACSVNIRNLGIVDSYFRGSGRVGTFAGSTWNNRISLTNCFSSATVISTGNGFWSGAGGLVGYIQSGQSVNISHCLFTGKVSGDPTYSGAILAFAGGNVSDCYYLTSCGATGIMNNPDVPGKTEGLTSVEISSGKAAYLLQKNQSAHIWGQNLPTDTLPSFKAPKVYPQYEYCKIVGYSNTESIVEITHDYLDNGTCRLCGGFESAILITESNYQSYGLNADYIGYYAIENYGQLYGFVMASNAQTNGNHINAVLLADITVNQQVLENGELVASAVDLIDWTSLLQFGGTFDGNGHFISGLYAVSSQNVGFASNCSGTIQNLFLKDTYFSTSEGYAGGIVGYLAGGSVIACGFDGYVSSADSEAGGIVGATQYDAPVSIMNCYNFGTVVGCGDDYFGVGGIVGYFYDGLLQYCYNIGQVSNACNGAIAGRLHNGSVTDNYYLAVDGLKGIGNKDEIHARTVAMTKNDMESGKLAMLLNQVSDISWGQDMSKDTYPTPYAKAVYAEYNGCVVTNYTNDEAFANTQPVHQFVNGYCSVCKQIEAAVLITADNLDNFVELDESFIGYYAIGNYGQLVWFRDHLIHSLTPDAKGVLVADITINQGVLTSDGALNEEGVENFISWTPITNFKGEFDGMNHTISGIYLNASTTEVGLFGYAQNATIKNLKIADSYIKGSSKVGAVAGKLEGFLENISVNAVVVGTGEKVGGIVGEYIPDADISHLEMRGSVTGQDRTGGVFGHVYGVNYTASYITNYASVSGSSYVGGIAGYFIPNAMYVSNEGSVNGSSYVGGIAGQNSGDITYAYNTGDISGSSYIGGILGSGQDVYHSLNAGIISGTGSGIGPIVGRFEGYESAENNYYIGTSEIDNHDGTTFMTAEQFTSGALTWFLNGGIDGKNDGTQIWYQTLGTDISPKFTGGTVYYGYENLVCTGTDRVYRNFPLYINQQHNYDNSGFCVCGRAEPGELITEANRAAYQLGEEYIGYYAIKNAGNLYWFARMSNGSLMNDFVPQNKELKVVLVENITVNDAVLNADGTVISDTSALTHWEIMTEFCGVLDGNGHWISGLYSVTPVSALITKLASGAMIQNLSIKDSVFVLATLVQTNYGSIQNCHSSATLLVSLPTVWSTDIGGICSEGMAGSFIHGCTFSGRFIASEENENISCLGGIVGVTQGTVSQSANFADISTMDIYKTALLGGIAGELYAGGRIENCYNQGDLVADTRVGGIVGYATDSAIVNCYNVGHVEARYQVGAIVGGIYGNVTVTNCYYLEHCAVDSNGNDFHNENVRRYVHGIGASQYDTPPADVSGSTQAVTVTDLASGEVAYLLNDSKTDGVWKQTLGIDGDSYPNFTGKSVYYGYNSCAEDATISYTNDSNVSATKPGHDMSEATCNTPSFCKNNCGYTVGEADASKHVYENGFCIHSDGTYQKPEGQGTAESPYLITNAGQLYWFAAVINTGYGDTARNLSAHAKLMNDITINENVLNTEGGLNNGTFRSWKPIGVWDPNFMENSDATMIEALLANAFDGTFDGNGKTIFGLYKNDIQSEDSIDVLLIGLFSNVGVNGIVKNLTISDSYFGGRGAIAGIAGFNAGTIENCINYASVTAEEASAGIASLNMGTVRNCVNIGVITSSGEVVGITSENIGTIENCYYLAETETDNFDGTFAKTLEQFKSGEVAYLLGSAWGQTLDGENKDAYPTFATDTNKVYQNNYCDDSVYGYSNTQSNEKLHKLINTYGYCEVCQVNITGASVTIGTNLAMNYYVFLDQDLAAQLDNITMHFSMSNGKTATANGTYHAPSGCYIFTFDQLPPQTMGDTIDAVLKLGDEVLTEMKDYSIKAYAEFILNAKVYENETKLLQLVSDMLYYGAAAQNYTKYNADKLVTEDVNGLLPASEVMPEKSDMSLVKSDDVTIGNTYFTSVGVWFDYNNRIYVKLSTTENVSLEVNGVKVTLDGTTYMTDGISATDFGKVFTFKLYENDILVQTLTYSVKSYVLAMQESKNPNMKALANALYAYGQSAEAFKEAINPGSEVGTDEGAAESA